MMRATQPLPEASPQDHSDAAARADELRDEGRHAEAISLLVNVIQELELLPGPVPAWPYARLALLHRHLQEYDEEVRVLERYQSLVPDGTHRSRFAARLSKASALADRQHNVRERIRMRA
jgi:hypothetical protein